MYSTLNAPLTSLEEANILQARDQLIAKLENLRSNEPAVLHTAAADIRGLAWALLKAIDNAWCHANDRLVEGHRPATSNPTDLLKELGLI